ncbi:SpoIIE family protein phosphatase [Leptolyngbya sp. FACHB-261]|nr:SpoIIE family protein phosphatase [Leptolyngbya sp. FACHB-261]
MPRSKPKILVIDDDPILCEILNNVLAQQGYLVSVAGDGEQGLAQAQAQPPELIICDWMMPGMDGLELCRRVKADASLGMPFFILLTARSGKGDLIRGLDMGADEFLAKPVDPEELQARVRAGLRLHYLSQELQTQKQHLETELARAAEYVHSLLPAPLQSSTDSGLSLQIRWRFIPSAQLGGDCFNYHWLDPDHLAVYLLDVSGHGVGAALLSVSVINLLRSRSLPVDFYKPDRVLVALNEAFPMADNDGLWFTLWYGVIDRKLKRLTYASAGHPPAVLLAEGQKPVRLRVPAIPVGLKSKFSYVSATQVLPEVGRLYLFSDGVYELMNSEDQAWGMEAFIQALTISDTQEEPAQVLDRMLQQAYTFQGSSQLEDDLSLVQICLEA